jgi:hypothetical protein
MTRSSKRRKNRRNKKLWKLRMKIQISNWRKEISKLPETGTASDNGKLNRKKRKIFQKYEMTNIREVAQLTRDIEAESASKSPKNQRIRRKGNRVYPKSDVQGRHQNIFKKLGHEE